MGPDDCTENTVGLEKQPLALRTRGVRLTLTLRGMLRLTGQLMYRCEADDGATLEASRHAFVGTVRKLRVPGGAVTGQRLEPCVQGVIIKSEANY